MGSDHPHPRDTRVPTELVSSDVAPSDSSLQIARRLLAREGSEGGRAPKDVSVALQRTVVKVSESLRGSIGDAGCQALLARALTQLEGAHPALTSMRRISESVIYPEGVAASVETHGAAPVTAAVEVFIAVLVDVLARLIGDDMAQQVIDHDPTKSPRRNGVER